VKPGVVGTALVIVAGCAAAVALYVKDTTQLERAAAARKRGEQQLASGDLAPARKTLEEAALAAAKVSGLTGRRSQALTISAAARHALRTLDALERLEDDPLGALRDLGVGDDAPEGAEAASARARADLLVDAAHAVELGGSIGQAKTLYAKALEAAEAAGSPRAAEAERGRRRVGLLEDLVAAEAALDDDREEDAGRLATSARKTLGEANSPFDDPARVEELKARVARILAEVEGHRLLTRYREAVRGLAAKVGGPELGTLLPKVEALKAPTLPTDHPRAARHAKQLEELVTLCGRVREVAEAFQGMVLARRGVYVDATEVTNAAYAEFVRAGGYDAKQAHWSKEGQRRLPRFRDRTRKPGPSTWEAGSPPAKRSDHPVGGVSLFEAQAYARWRGKRLPTLKEWRSAAGRGEAYPWGDLWEDGKANVRTDGTRPVGSFPAGKGPTGALDVIGNVREIVTAGAGKFAVAGGSYRSLPEHSTAKSAVSLSPSVRSKDTGFRCAKDLKWND
jgi:hypothetical protein